MYLPNSFRTDDLAEIHALMRQNSFAILTTQHDGTLSATHLPFMVDTERGPHGTLLAHMARANPQWRCFAAGQEALVIFHGPHAYISPSWYEMHPSVPTWNYAIVHAYGIPRVIQDDDRLRQMLGALVDTHESGFEQPWRMDLPADYMERQTRAIVGFEIEITRLEGKLKLSQNRAETDRRRVIEALERSEHVPDLEVAKMMSSRAER